MAAFFAHASRSAFPSLRAAACVCSPVLGASLLHSKGAVARCENPVPSAAILRGTHELRGPQAKDARDPLPSAGPTAGARPTTAFRRSCVSIAEKNLAAVCAEASSTVAADLATYWSNSVRPYALKGSPFLRPQVFASMWRMTISVDGTLVERSLPASEAIVEVSASLKGAHDRRLLELDVDGALITSGIGDGDQRVTFTACSWCIATKPEPRFPGVVVPPVPLGSDAMEKAAKRFKELNERSKRLRLVKPADAESSCDSSPCPLSLTVSADDSAADRIAGVYGRSTCEAERGGSVCDTKGACADPAPVIRDAIGLAASLADAQNFCDDGGAAAYVELEVAPVVPNQAVQLCARRGKDNGVVFVTGWVRGEPVMRLRATGLRPTST